MYNFLMDFIFCLSGIQVRLVNLPRGENIRDARISRSLQSWLESYLPNGYNADFVYLYNRVTVDINFEDQADNDINDENDPSSPGVDPSPRVSGHSGAERVETSDIPISDNELANNPVQNVGISADESEVQLPRTPRRRMKKRNRKCVVQRNDSSSENEEHPRPLRRRRRQKGPAETRDFPDQDSKPPGKELASSKRKRGKNRNVRRKQMSGKAAKSQDCEEEPVICQPRRKKNKGPVQDVNPFPKNPVEEIFPGPSRQSKQQNGNKRKRVTLHDKYPIDDPESSGEEFVPSQRRKRSKKKKEAKDEDNK